MMKYYSECDSLNAKVSKYEFTVEEVGGELMGVAVLTLNDDLTEKELDLIKSEVTGQASELLATVNSKNTGDELGMEIRRLRDEKQALQNEQASRQDLKKRIDELMRFLNDLPCELIDYEEDYVRTLLEKITVYDDHIIVEFKSGIEIQIDKEI